MAFSNRVTAITQDSFVPAVIDEVFNGNVLTCRLLARTGKRWQGETLRVPIQVTASSTGGSFDGTDTFDTAAQENLRRLSFDPKWYYQSVVVVGTERAINGGSDAQQVSLVRASLDIGKTSMLNSLGTLFYGLGVSKDIQGLGAIVDDGTDVGTYGGLSRTTFTVLNSTRTAVTAGALTLDVMATQFDAAAAAGSDQESPNLLVTTKAVWAFYESLLTPSTRANYNSNGYPVINAYTPTGVMARGDGLKGFGGFRSLDFRGCPVVADDKCTSQNLFFLNENYLDFYSVTDSELQSYPRQAMVVEGVYSEPGKMTGNYPMQWKPFDQPVNQYAQIGQFILGGNLISGAPRRMSRLTGITTA